jgi:hypothetical protein
MLSEGELLTLSAAMPLLEQYCNTPIESSIKHLFTKLMDMMPAEVSIDPSFGVWNTNEKPAKIELPFDVKINTLIFERTWHEIQELSRGSTDNSRRKAYNLFSSMLYLKWCW